MRNRIVSGKRSLKKQQKRQASALAQLEDLYRQGRDDEFLAHFAFAVIGEAGGAPPASTVTAKWTEVADRALRQSLARSDLNRLDRLLRSLRRCGPPRPLGILAEGVLDLAAGRRDEAREKFAALAASKGAAGAFPPSLLADLEALVRDEPDETCRQEIEELFAILEGQAFAPTTADVEALAERLETLQALAPEDAGLRALLDRARQCLSVLVDLAALLESDEALASPAALAWLRGPGGSRLAATLGTDPPALLAPLRHAVQIRWRTVLERVVAREGSLGLRALWKADPKLLAHHVSLPGGTAAVHDVLRQRAQVEELLAADRYEELAQCLRSRSRTVSEPGALAALWSLELWACRRWISSEDESEEDDDLLHRILLRLGGMAGEVGRRIPAEQRAGVARVLRDELFDLCEEVILCDHVAETALALLEHQPGDTGLLLVGMAGAVGGDAPRALRSLEALIARDGKAGTVECGPIEKRLMARIAREGSRTLARLLDAVRPLFSVNAWPEITEIVAQEMGGAVAGMLGMAGLMSSLDPGGADLGLHEIRGKLGLLRPALGGTAGFAAVELALDGCRLDPSAAKKRLARFLGDFPGLEAALAAFQVLEKALSPWAPKGIDATFEGLVQATIDRLDDRWQLWCPAVPSLALSADGARLGHLKKKVQQLLDSPEIEAGGREVLDGCLLEIRRIETRRSEIERPRRRSKPKKKPRRRKGRSRTSQFSLDFP